MNACLQSLWLFHDDHLSLRILKQMIADATGSSRSQGCREPLPELSVVHKEYPGEEKREDSIKHMKVYSEIWMG